MSDPSATAAADPLVSVVTPCYNAARWIAETAASVAAQSYPAVEHIVVDDGSSDGSWAAIEALGDRVRAFRRPNGGAARARNFGAAQARGEWILFLDADDLLEPDTVEALVRTGAGRHDWIPVCPWSRWVERDGAWRAEPADVPFPQTHPDALVAWLQGEWIAGCSLLWPAALFRELGGYDESLTTDEDGDLAYRALARGALLPVAEGGRSLYRSHGAALSLSTDLHTDHRFRSRMRVYEKLEAELRARECWSRYEHAVGIAYHRLAQATFATRPDLARVALARGEAYAGRQSIAPTLPGRLLVGLFGMEGKERVVRALARLGVATRNRRVAAARADATAAPDPEIPA